MTSTIPDFRKIKFNRWYWIPIGAGTAFHGAAIVMTWYAIHLLGATETNPYMHGLFSSLGLAPAGIISMAIIPPLLFVVPFLSNENEKIGLKTAMFMAVFVGLMGLDALHDFFAITNNDLQYVTYGILQPIISSIQFYQ